MATLARRGRPERSVARRLRAQLNQEVLKRVTKALDAVCDAFEEELDATQPNGYPHVLGVNNYELFYDCCTRLAKYIDANMATTPGFLEQMDRLIVACHSGTTGPMLRHVMTKDLQIRRRDRDDVPNGGKEPGTVKVESTSVVGDKQPDISPTNSTISQTEFRVGGGTEGLRQWGTRKRLSTKTRQKAKRARCSVTFWRSEEDSEEEEKKQREESEEEDFEETPSVDVQAILKRGPVGRARRRNCVRQLEQEFEKEEPSAESMDVEVPSETVQRENSAEKVDLAKSGKTGKSVRYDLRKTPQRKRMSGESRQAEQEEDKSCIEKMDQNETMEDASVHEETDTLQVEESSENKDGDSLNDRNRGTIDGAPNAKERLNTRECDQVTSAENSGNGNTSTQIEQPIAISKPNSDEEKEGNMDGVLKDSCKEVSSPTETSQNDAVLQRETDEEKIDDTLEITREQPRQPKEPKPTKVGLNDTQQLKVDTEPERTIADKDEPLYDINSDAGMISQPKQEIDKEQIEKEMRQLVRNLEAGEGSLDMSVARTRFQALLGQLTKDTAADDDSYPKAATPPNDVEPEEIYALDDDSSERDDDPPVPGLCDARMRSPQQIANFKLCLRRAIVFVDAVLCQPPPGKVCSKQCEKVRTRQCRDGVPCRDTICRNWHKTEAHTDHCKNPLCEFRNRILLREIKHQVANKEPQMLLQHAQWKEKSLMLFAATSDEADGAYTLDELTQMSDELGQLELDLDKTKEEIASMKDTRRVLLANLSAIGIKPQNDAGDHFPDFESHYVNADNDSLQ